MKYLFQFLILFLSCIPSLSAQGKLFIIGGGKRSPAMLDRLWKEAGLASGGYGIILPMASEEPDSALYFAKKQFGSEREVQLMGWNLEANEALSTARFDSLVGAKLIYICGGDQNRFMRVANSTPIAKALQQAYQRGAMMAGTSAGAAVMSEKMITGNELKHPAYSENFQSIEADNLELGTGLGFVKKAIVDQHFLRRSRHNRLLCAIIENPALLGIGIDEATAILVKGKEVEVVGEAQVVVYANPNRSKKVKEGKLGAKGLTLGIYLPGEKFRIE